MVSCYGRMWKSPLRGLIIVKDTIAFMLHSMLAVKWRPSTLEYDLDLTPDQVSGWLKDEIATGSARVNWRASIEYLAGDDVEVQTADPEDHAGIHAVSKVGVIEISPRDTSEGWVLRVHMSDSIGDHVPEDVSIWDEPQEIDLEDYYKQLIVPESAIGNVSMSLASERSEPLSDRLIADIVSNRHVK